MKKIAVFSLFTLLSMGLALGQSEKPIHEIHAAMIYNFMKYIQWPDDGGTEFVVGVLGEDNVFNTLKNFYDGKPKGTNIPYGSYQISLRLVLARLFILARTKARILTM